MTIQEKVKTLKNDKDVIKVIKYLHEEEGRSLFEIEFCLLCNTKYPLPKILQLIEVYQDS
ncbi:hypothetical protein LCGC14_1609780 [marine sediment metagenome]|uniref:Uncharacterized protein n=1 Tax=marine sediment metagenome TaxID=412755 RepID=A0A0F9I8X5_9ZZZZ